MTTFFSCFACGYPVGSPGDQCPRCSELQAERNLAEIDKANKANVLNTAERLNEMSEQITNILKSDTPADMTDLLTMIGSGASILADFLKGLK